jgi:hypothetical protein
LEKTDSNLLWFWLSLRMDKNKRRRSQIAAKIPHYTSKYKICNKFCYGLSAFTLA